MKKGNLLIISGFSGVGKGTVVKHIMDNYDDYRLSVSVTTRKPRNYETDGVHYHFITNDKFENMVNNNQLLEHAGYVNNYYGTPREFVDTNIEQGNNVILEIETKGAIQVKKVMPDAKMIFVLPPDADTLKARLIGRNTETIDVINQRLKKAAEETDVLDNYEYFVINDIVDKCAANIDKIAKDNNPELADSDFVENIKKDIMKFSKGE